MFPVPANSSSKFSSSKFIVLLRILKRLSLAKSVVGRTAKFFGVNIDLPLFFPPTILTAFDV